jgi:predicted Zn-dependent protease
MPVQSARSETMLKGIFYQYLLKAVLIALIALILYGVFPGTGLAIILTLFVGLRFSSLAAEALRKPVSAERWETMVGALTSSYEKLTPETGPQWDETSLVQVFTNATRFFPKAPIKYILITPVDIYVQDANYVFSTTYNWGAVVSSARYGGPPRDDTLLRQRTAKQALCALLKSFNVPASTDRDDVTSYTRSLAEFDMKGNHPDAETLKLFQQAVADVNNKWQKHKAMQHVPR